MENKSLIERRVRKKLVFTGGAVDFRADTVRLPNGKPARREFMAHPGAVAVLPVLPDGSVIMVRQYRYPVGEVTLELPAGKLHSRRDDPRGRAAAELKEETGYSAGTLRSLMSFWPTPAFSSEILHIYLAAGLKAGTACPDDDEFLRTERLPFAKALRLVEAGKIKDAKTVIALQAYALSKLALSGSQRVFPGNKLDTRASQRVSPSAAQETGPLLSAKADNTLPWFPPALKGGAPHPLCGSRTNPLPVPQPHESHSPGTHAKLGRAKNLPQRRGVLRKQKGRSQS